MTSYTFNYWVENSNGVYVRTVRAVDGDEARHIVAEQSNGKYSPSDLCAYPLKKSRRKKAF